MRSAPAVSIDLHVPLDDTETDRIYLTVDDVGATAVEERKEGLRLFFVDARARDRALHLICAAHPTLSCAALDVPDEDWAARSQAALGPVRVGQFVIAPPAAGLEPDARTLVIQPSMGFGTGHHASTRLCLALLQDIDCTGASAIDVGTGSGVLAIAAWRMGASTIVAIDRDPDALEAARDSIDRNGAAAHVTTRRADLSPTLPAELGETYDVILANLTGATIERHAAVLRQLAAPSAQLIVSGVMTDERTAVVDALGRAGWTAVAQRSEEEWRGVLLRVNGAMSEWVNR